MTLYHIHNRQRMVLRPYDQQGRLRPQALRRFARFMRCAHTDEIQKIHWRVLVLLYDLWLQFGQPQVTVFSGNRPKVVARLKTSKHVSGRAIDFNFDGVANSRLRDYVLKNYSKVGVGFYPNSWHIHLDVRPKKTFWIDYGGPGEEANYAKAPRQDLRRGLARRGYKPPRGKAGRTGVGRIKPRPLRSGRAKPGKTQSPPVPAVDPPLALRKMKRRPARPRRTQATPPGNSLRADSRRRGIGKR